ncbi:MAG TPA: Slp family lipoprotein [Rhodanobacter sp.]
MRIATHPLRPLAPLLALAFTLALAACAPAPIYKMAPTAVMAVPSQVAQSPERYAGNEVIWGGRIVDVQNFADHSEVELLAYPLDSSQRPKAGDAGNGRFIAVMPGYAEPLNYPAGALMTVSGKLNGSRAGKVGEADYVFPLVGVAQSHVWTADEMNKGRNNFHFGVGVGVGIH